MIRTQIYLTPDIMNSLSELKKHYKKSKSELIRMALSNFIKNTKSISKKDYLKAGKGIWKDHTSLSDFQDLRVQWDRH